MLDYFGFHSNYENNKLINEIKCQIKKDKNKKKDNDKGNSISEIICSLKEDLPEDEQTKIDNCYKNFMIFMKLHNKKNRKYEKLKKKIKNIHSDDNTVVVNGKIKPMDHSDDIGNFNTALKCFKRKYNIPKNQNPDYWTDNYDRRGKCQKGEVYIFKIRKNGKDVLVECRNDKDGHHFEDGYSNPGHINGPKDEHYFHTGQGKLHNISYISKKDYEKLKKQYGLYK